MSRKYNISYTARDAESIKNDLLNKIPDLTEDWTDFRESDSGIVLLELMSMLGDMLFYSLDRKALETYLISSEEKQNVRAQIKPLNYKMHTYRSADALCKFSTEHTAKIPIPKYTTLSTKEVEGESISYVTYEDAVIPAESYKNIKVKQGELVELDNFTNRDIVNNRIDLPDMDIAEDTIILTIDEIEWKEVEDVVLQTEPGRFFSMEFDKYDNVYIKLFPGWRNLIDNENTMDINIKYLKSLGKNGSVGQYVINSITSDVFDINGVECSGKIKVENPERSTSGEDPQDLEEVKQSAIESAQTMRTAVTLEDYEVLGKDIDGIANAQALDWCIAELEELYSSITIGSGEDGRVTITADKYGGDGNNYHLEIIDNTGESDVDMSATKSDYKITLNLGTDSNGDLDDTKNTADKIVTEIDILSDVNASYSGTGQGSITSEDIPTENPKYFSGGFGPSEPYVVYFYAVPDDVGQVTEIIRDNITEFFRDKRVATVDFHVQDTSYYIIDFEIDVMTVPGSYIFPVETAIMDALEEFFNPKDRSFSELIKHSTLIRILEDSHDDIISANLVTPLNNVVVPFGYFPKLGDININIVS